MPLLPFSMQGGFFFFKHSNLDITQLSLTMLIVQANIAFGAEFRVENY